MKQKNPCDKTERTHNPPLSHQMGISLYLETPDDHQKHVSISVLWSGGTISVQCVGFQPSIQSEIGVSETIQQFANECQLMFVLYDSVMRSRNPILKNLRNKKNNRNALFVVADTARDGTIQEVWAQVPLGVMVDAFMQGGEFETIFAKAFVVLVYQLWEEVARHKISLALEVGHNDVKSDLMGEWRYLRNWIVHPSSESEQDFFKNATMLTKMPDSPQHGQPVVTAKMMKRMMGYLNSLNIVVSKSDTPAIVTVKPAPLELLRSFENLTQNDKAP